MPASGSPDDIPIGDVMVIAFRAECENAALRRLVMSMALCLPIDFIPEDERALLRDIIYGEPDDIQP